MSVENESILCEAEAVRPEKEHSKQLHAIARLFTKHPEYRSGSSRVTLTMMGGARHPADEQRVESLRSLSRELGVQASPIVKSHSFREAEGSRTTLNFC